MNPEEIAEKIAALESRADELLQKADTEGSTAEDIKSFREKVETEIVPEIERLQAERAAAERAEEVKALKAKVGTLDEVIEELRKPIGPFALGSEKALDGDIADNPYSEGKASFFRDIHLARMGRPEARERLELSTKAMTEGGVVGHTDAGYLVQPQIERQIVEARENDNVLRALATKYNITTNELELSQLGLATTAGWVAELAVKPESTSLNLATVSASVFTAAGLATVSNQLLADSNPAVDRLVTADLSKRLVAVEETAFLTGTGSGQPLGILNTSGLQAVTLTSTSVTADGGLLDAILDAIGQVQSEHGEPTAIVMHPRTWTRVLKAKDAQGVYLVGPEDVQSGRRATKSIFGVRVVTTNRMPTNLGGGTNESRIIVGDFSEALILDRQGITVDESPHVYFTTNQTVFRAEMRVGFTAARAPKAFSVIGGTGLANG